MDVRLEQAPFVLGRSRHRAGSTRKVPGMSIHPEAIIHAAPE
jgi:hypothetical protein